MTFRIHPLLGIFRPEKYSYQLKEAEAFRGYKRMIALLFFVSLCTYGVSAGFGIGTESLSKEITNWTNGELEVRKQLFFVGRLLLGLLVPCVFLFLSSLYYWCFSNGSFKKYVIMQMTVFCIYLLEQIIQIPMFVLLHIDATSNPLSLGIAAQYLTNKEIIIHFFSQITIFQIGMMFVVVYYLRKLTELTKKQVISIVILLFVFYWAISSLFSYIKIGVFF
ncbi:hypothetical protein [Bacillus massiliigorillae]|uniref:hypothetical protein n=1 Tax=Bacillus massiliigorillae TaxID=1243664 RepID=UPI00039A1F74|nr:hypothetical protein [Bacillus massiliigorillae]